MNKKQRKLLLELAYILEELGEQCELDDNFHNIMIENNDLITMSLDELSAEWVAVANGEERVRLENR